MMAAAGSPGQVPDGHPLRGYGSTTRLMRIPPPGLTEFSGHPQASGSPRGGTTRALAIQRSTIASARAARTDVDELHADDCED